MYTLKYGMIEAGHVPILESYLEKNKNNLVIELGCGYEHLGKKARYTNKYLAIEKG